MDWSDRVERCNGVMELQSVVMQWNDGVEWWKGLSGVELWSGVVE